MPRFPGDLPDEPVGHVPADRCLACGGEWEELEEIPHEPCPAQEKARALVSQGYTSLPSSPESFQRFTPAYTVGRYGSVHSWTLEPVPRSKRWGVRAAFLFWSAPLWLGLTAGLAALGWYALGGTLGLIVGAALERERRRLSESRRRLPKRDERTGTDHGPG